MRRVDPLSSLAGRLASRTGPAVDGEGGFVLVIAIILLLVVTLAIGAISIAAQDVNNQSTRQGQSQLADAAADSGAQVALYRLNTAGTTTAGTGTMAGGASYSYTVTALTSSSSACAGLWVESTASTLDQDCITSTGTVNGVSERVEMRVVGYALTSVASLFPVNGVFATDGFTSSDTISGAFNLGSNGVLPSVQGIATVGGIQGKIEYLSGKLDDSTNPGQTCAGTCSLDLLSSAITVPSVSASVYASAASTNNDLTSGDVTYSNASFSSSTHVITVTNNSSVVTFAPGTYYLCGINVAGFNSFSIDTSGAGLVKIYIDSPSRSGTSCASGTGDIYNVGNGTDAINVGGTSSDLQIYFYGDPGCTTACPEAFTTGSGGSTTADMNSGTFNADIFAPNSALYTGGAFSMSGALVIAYVQANNSFSFTYQTPTGTVGGSGSSTYASFYPQAHQDCVSSTSSC